MLKIVFLILVAVHGLIHIMGVVKAFHLADIKELTLPISKPMGIIWLLAAVLFLATFILFLLHQPWWWMAAVPALVLSQLLIFVYWKDAKFGTLANVLILLPTIVAYGHWSFSAMAQNELREMWPTTISPTVVTESELSALPPIVATWLRQSQAVGKARIARVHLEQRGEMRTSPEGKWMPFTAEQWFATAEPAFLWWADVKAAPGFFFTGRDKYMNGQGHMLIKILSLFPVADATGSKIDQGTLLRYLAETCWFPSAASHETITWESLDSTSARATMTYRGVSASGTFSFTETGILTSFQAQRYYSDNGDGTLETWLVENDVTSLQEFQGMRIPTQSTVTWKLDSGDYTWLRLKILNIQYNKAAKGRLGKVGA